MKLVSAELKLTPRRPVPKSGVYRNITLKLSLTPLIYVRTLGQNMKWTH